MGIRQNEEFNGFPLEEGYTKAAYIAINKDSKAITVNAYKYFNKATRDEEPSKILGGRGTPINGVELTDEEMDAIFAIVYGAIGRTEDYKDGVKQ